MLGMTGLTACTGLSESEAEALVRAEFEQLNPRTCLLTLVKRRPDGNFTINDGPGAKECFDQIVSAGFGKRLECRDQDDPAESGTCRDRAVVPAGGAHGSAVGFTFRCGTFSLISIQRRKKLHADAVTVHYIREFDTPFATSFSSCDDNLFMPEPGTHEKSMIAERKSDGSWTFPDWQPLTIQLL